MRITDTKELEICSAKQLYERLANELPDKKTIAIFLTNDVPKHRMLNLLDDMVYFKVWDALDIRSHFAFNYMHGLHVRGFLQKNDDFEKLYVCCDSGESRSSAMAAAILRYYGGSDRAVWKNPHYHPNTLVYTEQMEAFGFKVGKWRLKYLGYINRKALRKAIKEGGK
ncbi:MAG: hypothetical protein IJO52_08345 [Clostridia bacterium]|nr:hypothetical protein [Clostridia bacterium]